MIEYGIFMIKVAHLPWGPPERPRLCKWHALIQCGFKRTHIYIYVYYIYIDQCICRFHISLPRCDDFLDDHKSANLTIGHHFHGNPVEMTMWRCSWLPKLRCPSERIWDAAQEQSLWAMMRQTKLLQLLLVFVLKLAGDPRSSGLFSIRNDAIFCWQVLR